MVDRWADDMSVPKAFDGGVGFWTRVRGAVPSVGTGVCRDGAGGCRAPRPGAGAVASLLLTGCCQTSLEEEAVTLCSVVGGATGGVDDDVGRLVVPRAVNDAEDAADDDLAYGFRESLDAAVVTVASSGRVRVAALGCL